jgi:potassium/hydrogen antiporter
VAEALPIDEVEADMVEVIVTPDLPVAGRGLRDVPLPEGMLLAAIVRQERVIVPRGDAVLVPDDVLLIVVQDPDRAAERVTRWARSEGPSTRSTGAPWPRARHRTARTEERAEGRPREEGYPGPDHR